MKQTSLRYGMLVRWLVLGLLLAAGSILVLFYLLHTPPVREAVLSYLQAWLRESQGIALRADHLRYRLARLEFQIDGLALSMPGQGQPFVQVDGLTAQLDGWSLLRGVPAVRQVVVEQLDLQLEVDADGRPNWPTGGEAGAGGIPAFLISDLRANDASLTYQDRSRLLTLGLPRWSLQVDGRMPTREHSLRLTSQQPGSLQVDGRELSIPELQVQLRLDPSQLILEEGIVQLGESRFLASGSVQPLDEPVLQIEAQTVLLLDELTALLGTMPATGRLEGRVSLEGPSTDLLVRFRQQGAELRLADFDPVRIETSGSWSFNDEEVELEQLSLAATQGNLNLAGLLSLDASRDSQLQGGLDGVDLGRVTARLDLPLRLKSRISGTFQATFPGLEFERGSLQGRLQARPLEARGSGEIPISGQVELSLRPDAIEFPLVRLESLGIQLRGRAAVSDLETLSGSSQGRLAGAFQGRVTSLEETLPGLKKILGDGPLEQFSQLAGSLDLQIVLSGTLHDPRTRLGLVSQDLMLDGLGPIQLDTEVDLDPSSLKLRSFRADWNQQRLEASGSVGLGGQPLQLEVELENVVLEKMLEGLGSEFPLQGVLSAQGQIQGVLDQPQARLVVEGSDLAVLGQPLGRLNASLAFQEATLVLESLQLDKTRQDGKIGVFSASGEYRPEDQDYRLDFSAGRFPLEGLGPVLGEQLAGDLDLTGRSWGQPQDPQMDVEGRFSGVHWKGNSIDPVQLRSRLRDGAFTLSAEVPGLGLTLEAQGQTASPHPIRFRVAAEQTDLAALPIHVPDLSMAGTLSGRIDGVAELARWQQGQVSLEIDQLALRLNDQAVSISKTLRAKLSSEGLEISSAALASGRSLLSLEGRLPLDLTGGEGDLGLEARLDLAEMAVLLPERLAAIDPQGELRLGGRFKGNLRRVDPTLTATLREARLNSPEMGLSDATLNLDMDLREGMLRLSQLILQAKETELSVQGSMPLGLLPSDFPVDVPRQPGAARLSGRLQNFQFAGLPGLPEALKGILDLEFGLEADRLDRTAIKGSVEVGRLDLDLDGYAIRPEGPVRLVLRDGALRSEGFWLTGTNTRMGISGSMTVWDVPQLDLSIQGSLDNRAVATLFTDWVGAGSTQLQLQLRGTLGQPRLEGTARLEEARFILRRPSLVLSDLDGLIHFSETRAEVRRFEGELNGGTLRISGDLDYGGGEWGAGGLQLEAREVYLNFPERVRTSSDLDLALVPDQLGGMLLSGQVRIREGSFTDPLTLQSELLRLARLQSGVESAAGERSPFLELLRFNVSVETLNPLKVRNNLASLLFTASLRLGGSYYRPGLTGRIFLEEGGELFVRERSYAVDRGIISFVDESRIRPVLDILSRTQAQGYDINLQIQGTPENLTTQFSSEPPLSQSDILAVLITGRTLDEMRGAEAEVAREQALSILAEGVGGPLSVGAAQALGLSRVRIEPNLIATESNPGARLTVGKDLTPDLRLIYSVNLVDSSDQIYVTEYDLNRRFNTRALFFNDNSYRFEFTHALRFGSVRPQGESARRSRLPSRIGELNFAGQPFFPEARLREILKLKPGDRYDFFQVERRVDRLERFYRKEGLLEFRIRTSRQSSPEATDLLLDIQAGPRVDLVFRGDPLPGGLRREVEEVWGSGVFDAQRADEALETIRRWLTGENFLAPQLSYSVQQLEPLRKEVIFSVERGTQFKAIEFRFPGAKFLSADVLQDWIREADLEQEAFQSPSKVISVLEQRYRSEGFMAVRVAEPRLQLDPVAGIGTAEIPVVEGPRYLVESILFDGNRYFRSRDLEAEVLLVVGETYLPDRQQRSIRALEELYFRQGFNLVQISGVLETLGESVAIRFEIQEHARQVVDSFRIEGNRGTSENFIRARLEIAAGDVLDHEKTSRSLKNLYDTGVYSLVEIDRESLGTGPDQDGIQKVALTVRVRELNPFELRYGGSFSTETGVGAVADFTNYNSLGSGRIAGLRGRFDSDQREVRGYFSQPKLFGLPLRTNLVTFFRREIQEFFITDRTGISLQQELPLKEQFIFSYGYRFERNNTFDKDPESIFQIEPFNLAPLTATLTRDTRDDLLDPTRGSFASQALEYAPDLLGSDLRYVKYFGQFFKYFPLNQPTRVPWAGSWKSRLVFASGVRVGLASGLGGQILVPSERFFAGGGTTLRGFDEDSVGPLNFLDQPSGGDAMFILNNELRFPLVSLLDGVAFLDMGNIYADVSDFDPFELRKSAGLGLRIRTPYFLLRFDYGVKLDRRAGESAGSLFFSIGQAF